ncbi:MULTISPECIES: macrolide family glycosyltransferase [Prauserella salsuginis group]|uniref:Macrolide family glycosyltransferase n=1 Tax=Prauserella salsuginis TaxID=387889 RepID=A0ABW6G8Z1_9PSEU|nr:MULTISPECIES: macrolide family glycosyltransferase [Prauserella salsuginis group]MCR3722520.1 glycosyltransferase, MGT family [Prauserella flava]MCR3736962.1 glycosyltransferase, MGT family [Prauserella salsuginis]
MHLVMVGVTAPSHVYPGLGLIAELVARGHRVTYVVGDRLTDLVAPTGAEVVTHPSIMPTADEHWPEDMGEAMQVFLDDAITALPVTLGIDRPDAVLYDIGGFAGRVAAQHWGVPAVQLSTAYVAWEGMAEEMAEFNEALRASPSGEKYYTTLRAWLDENGMDIGADEFTGTPPSCVVLIPRVLQPNADRVADRYVFAGPCVDPARRTGWEPEPGDERPLVYVALGTSYTERPDIYRACIDGLAGDYRVVLATGKVDPADLGELPPGVTAARAQPQLDVLEHASVFVSHAGMGSAAESLWFGVPTVLVPQAVDQSANAGMLAEIGAGMLPEEPWDAPTLRAAVDAARGKADRTRELQAQVRAGGGIDRAAHAVERLGARSSGTSG